MNLVVVFQTALLDPCGSSAGSSELFVVLTLFKGDTNDVS